MFAKKKGRFFLAYEFGSGCARGLGKSGGKMYRELVSITAAPMVGKKLGYMSLYTLGFYYIDAYHLH